MVKSKFLVKKGQPYCISDFISDKVQCMTKKGVIRNFLVLKMSSQVFVYCVNVK